MKSQKGKMTLMIQFPVADKADTFGRFCKALIDGGFEDVVRAMGKKLIQEAKRRKLPIVKELGLK
jgi:hypothetical protein